MSRRDTGGGKEPAPRMARVLDASANVEADTVVHRDLEMPFDGWLVELFTQFPPGSNNQVGVQVYDKERGDRIFPENEDTEFLTGDDYSKAWRVVQPVEEHDEIEVTIDNRDTGNPHFQGAALTVVGKDVPTLGTDGRVQP